MNNVNNIRVIISGGGTGGHLYPALAIANAIKKLLPQTEILFVGALNKIEMEKVPAAGYNIIGLPVKGFQRKITLKNINVLWNLYISLKKSKAIIEEFKPNVVIGTGGFASAPILRVATKKRIPTIIQEQNSFPGITNKILAPRVNLICVAYENMDKYFPANKIKLTGNPIRQDILQNQNILRQEGYSYFGFNSQNKTVLSLGGSLGALTINESIYNNIEKFTNNNIQLIWQTGKNFYFKALDLIKSKNIQNVKVFDFIERMDYAYAVADVVISRAGAITISELASVAKPAILVPSPNVAEDHQTKNAMVLVANDAATLVPDSVARQILVDETIKLLNDEFRLKVYKNNISRLSFKNAAEIIAKEALKLAYVELK
ncbi:MAG: undecaprenyldiphospho-muramoylpentapeptide beta-N-acetylglucosaminyltransferase [Bacteroidales bacterium]|nr:undecaprenyldiphospho-muramoylpentapeptide beta-N-acetylglucosaminyltransferase [Bacteroidales bacterium]